MKMMASSKELIRVFLYLFLLFPFVAYSASQGVVPNPGHENDTYTFTIELDGSLPSNYDVNLELGDGGGGWLDQGAMPAKNSNRKVFSYNRRISTAGDRKYRFAFYEDREFIQYNPSTGSYEYTVLPKPPSFHSGSVSPSSAKSGSDYTFKSAWTQENDHYIVNALFRYRPFGESSWAQSVMPYSSTTSNRAEFIKKIRITTAGEYEYQFRASSSVTAGDTGEASNWTSSKYFSVTPVVSVTDRETIKIINQPNSNRISAGSFVLGVRGESDLGIKIFSMNIQKYGISGALSGTYQSHDESGDKTESHDFTVDISNLDPGRYEVILHASDRDESNGGGVDTKYEFYKEGTTNYDVITKTCSQVNSNYPYECQKQQTVFKSEDSVISWIEFTTISQGTYHVEWLFVNDEKGVSQKYTYSLNSDGLGWYRLNKFLTNKHDGDWRVEIKLDGIKIAEDSFSIRQEDADRYKLNVNISGNGNVLGGGIWCGPGPGYTDCDHLYKSDIGEIKMTAEQHKDYAFENWSYNSGCQAIKEEERPNGNNILYFNLIGDCTLNAKFSGDEPVTAPVLTQDYTVDFHKCTGDLYRDYCVKTHDTATSTIKFEITDANSDLSILHINCDGEDAPEIEEGISGNTDSVTESCKYSTVNDLDGGVNGNGKCPNNGNYRHNGKCWKRDITLTATAYDSLGNDSNVHEKEIILYDSDRWKEWKSYNEAKRIELENKIDALNERISTVNSELEVINLQANIDFYLEYAVDREYIESLDISVKPHAPCLWLDAKDNCVLSDPTVLGRQFGVIVDSEDPNYEYRLYVQYAFNLDPGAINNYPAVVRTEYQHYERPAEIAVLANNPEHLRFLVGMLAETAKNYIDGANGIQSNLSEQYEEEIADIEPTKNFGIDDRIKNSIDKSYSSIKSEIEASGNKASKSLSVALDPSQDRAIRLENGFRYTYQLTLGTLKVAVDGVAGLIYGAFEPEAKEAIEKISAISQEQFEKLPEEHQQAIIGSVDVIADAINTNEETKAAFETGLIYIGAKYAKSTGKDPSDIILKRKTSVRKGVALALAPKPTSLKAVFGTAKGTFSRTLFEKSGAIYQLPKILKEKIKLKKGASDKKKGDLSEEIAEYVFDELLPEYKKFDGTYDGINGFDHVYMKKNAQDVIEEIVIVEVKQLHNGAAALRQTGKFPQMTDEWINDVALSLIKEGKTELALAVINNPKLITKFLVGTDDSVGTLNCLKINTF